MALHIEQIACGEHHSLVLLSDGSVWATGCNSHGQLGDGTTKDKTTWFCVMSSGSDVIQVASGGEHSFALKSDGSVWATGYNEHGQLGDGTLTNKTTWTPVIPSGVTQVAAGADHSLSLKSDGSVWASGRNKDGQLGDGTHQDIFRWVPVMPEGSRAIQVAAGGSHSFVLKADGSVWATGQNHFGQLGDGTITHRNGWKSVMAAGSGVIRLAAGFRHSLALFSDGHVCCSGRGWDGQLGNAGLADECKMISTVNSSAISITTGLYNSFVIKSGGSLWVSGSNSSGQLGVNSTSNQHCWQCSIDSGVKQISSGLVHSLAIKSDGTLWKTGKNDYGQLGFEEPDSLVWVPDRFFEKIILESLMDESKFEPDSMSELSDEWRGFSL